MTDGADRVGWVPPDGSRNTLGVIWSCLLVFVICSWKCVHLNMPSREETEAGWHWAWGWLPCWPEAPLRRKWTRKARWMLTMCMAPEFVVVHAAREFRDARKMMKYAGEGFTTAHAFFAAMGGIVLRLREAAPNAEQRSEAKQKSEEFLEVCLTLRNLRKCICKCLPNDDVFRGETLIFLGILERHGLPVCLSDVDIRDRSKADALTKTIAISQSTWLIVQLCGRAAHGLAITELELVTAAFVSCAFATYVLWWHKPFNAERPYIIFWDLPSSEWAHFYRSINDCNLGTLTRLSVGPQSRVQAEFDRPEVSLGWEYDAFWSFKSQEASRHRRASDELDISATMDYFIFCGTGVIFSLIHLVSWNWSFPSPKVQLVWRIAAMIAVGSSVPPLPLVVAAMACDERESRLYRRASLIFMSASVFITFSYLVARATLLVLTLYCFSSMPVSAYEPLTWTSLLPHFG
jgi:hypothetical protein